jgi:trans-aconitate 2-methyltransferase
MAWDPEQYQRFQRERAAPFADVLALVARRPGLRVIDLGCGTGELTRALADALPESDVTGLDSSSEMLAKAAKHARPGLRFVHGTVEDFTYGEGSGATRGVSEAAVPPRMPGDNEWDLIFSHAALHWVAHHRALVPRLVGQLRPGGQLVVQLPSNAEHPTQTHLRRAAAESPFAEALGGWSYDWPVLTINDYGELLHRAGARELTVFEKLYAHLMPGADELAEWMRGTATVPYLERLPASLHEPFLARYRERLRAEWPASPVFFGFRRTIFCGTRA